MGGIMKTWVIRFRVISQNDYHTPMMYIPIQETRVKAETEDEAWEFWITEPYGAPRDWYKKEEIYED